MVFLEGSAPALPRNSFGLNLHFALSTLFWLTCSFAFPNSQTPNKFGAQKGHHQPLAKASGMEYGLVVHQNNSRYGL